MPVTTSFPTGRFRIFEATALRILLLTAAKDHEPMMEVYSVETIFEVVDPATFPMTLI